LIEAIKEQPFKGIGKP